MKKSTKEKVLDALMETEGYLSGEDLSSRLGVSRTSIWKHIKKLKEEGYEITSVTNKGYRIVGNPGGLVESLLLHELNDYGFDVVKVYDTIDSTNLAAKREANNVQDAGLFISLEQTLGKGRRGKAWVSQKKSGIYMSLLLRPDIEPREASMLTILGGMAVNQSIQELYQMESKIKWPNDIVIKKRKVCGILTEMNAEIDYLNYVVIGIGINMGKQTFPEEISQMATSLGNEIDQEIQVEAYQTLIIDVVKRLTLLIKQLEKNGNLKFIKDEYEKACVNIAGELRILAKDGDYCCTGQGINDQGELLVRLEDGTIKTVYSGEVSVRGLYGYV